ncbi:MAG: hypothetical protein WAU65_02675 [Candidatus Nanoarchaeia archaeon]
MKNNSLAKVVSTAALIAGLSAPLAADGLYGFARIGADLNDRPPVVQNDTAEKPLMGNGLAGTFIGTDLELRAALGYDSGKFDLKVGPKLELALPVAREGYASSTGLSVNPGLFARASLLKYLFAEGSATLNGAYSSDSSQPTHMDYVAKAGVDLPMFSASSGKMEGGFGEAYFGVSIPQTLGNVSVPQGSSLDTKPSLVFGLEFGFETQ